MPILYLPRYCVWRNHGMTEVRTTWKQYCAPHPSTHTSYAGDLGGGGSIKRSFIYCVFFIFKIRVLILKYDFTNSSLLFCIFLYILIRITFPYNITIIKMRLYVGTVKSNLCSILKYDLIFDRSQMYEETFLQTYWKWLFHRRLWLIFTPSFLSTIVSCRSMSL